MKTKNFVGRMQLGVDLLIGMNKAAYHVIVELYDRGNIILTDHEFTILYILRPHHEGQDLRFAVREKYPLERTKQGKTLPTKEQLRGVINEAEEGNSLRFSEFLITTHDTRFTAGTRGTPQGIERKIC
ncbi:hypothetical protein GQX74_009058 [Glossina fuscipes]|nr:hypothetical protein GQX74_009058 [Glossina fuscipes]